MVGVRGGGALVDILVWRNYLGQERYFPNVWFRLPIGDMYVAACGQPGFIVAWAGSQ